VADPGAVWEARGVAARMLRAGLLPAAGAFRAGTTVRNWLYDVGALRSRALKGPTVSVGNLSVGGTGKTPFTSWIATALQKRGARPAILLRGYSDDETQVHRMLAAGIPVYANPDRVAASYAAHADGADVMVLDDAFQHRRAARDEDIVLVSADARAAAWPLPAGPWREPFRALRRATLVAVTRKAAPDDAVAQLLERVSRAAGSVPVAVVRFEHGVLRAWGSAGERPLVSLAGQRPLLVSAIGDPAAFEAQIGAAGIAVEPVRFADHHSFTASEIAKLAERAVAPRLVICTLKDAVKLGPLWPPEAGSLWYVSQRIAVERGDEHLTRIVGRILALRPETRPGDSHR